MLGEWRRRLLAAQRARAAGRPPSIALEPPAPTCDPPPAPDPAALEEVQRADPALHAELLRLDPHQLHAVLHPGPAVLVKAQVGSGKTTVLVLKALWLLRVRGLPPEQLAALTFTRRAAGEVIRRLAAHGVPAGSLARVGTFHAVARRLLLRELCPGQPLVILDAGERDALWERLIEAHGLRVRERRRLARRIEATRRGLPWGRADLAPDDLPRLLALYAAEKRDRGWLDLEDLLERASELLGVASVVRPGWILVDELQDASAEQLRFLERLAGPATAWLAVGDPRQSIYSWRGATPELLLRFARERRAETIALPLNYRSTAAILEGARALLPRAGPGDLVAVRPAGEPPSLVAHQDPLAEAAWVAERLLHHHRGGTGWDELAVLFRLREQAEPLAAALGRAGIPCQAPPPPGAREQEAVVWLREALLAGLLGRGERARRALLHPRAGFLLPRQARWLAAVPAADPGLLETRAALAAALARARGPRRARSARALRAALAWVARLAELPAWLAGAEGGARELLAHLDVATLLRPTASTWARDLAAVEAWLARWLARTAGDPFRLAELLARGAWTEEEVEAEGRDEGERVRLLTLHGAKGLEWRRVFLVGLNDGLLPLGGGTDPEALAEERRLFFVGLTRAKDGLELSWCRLPGLARARGVPSSFLGLLTLAPPPEPEPVAPPAAWPWSPGQSVRHRRYGPGEVVSIGSSEVVCRFASGEKRFALAACPLVPS